jgi:outer membrane protein TolC
VNKRFLTFFLSLTFLGCSADDYRRDADLQVAPLLKDRKQTTLGYVPKTEVKSEDVAPPTKKSYAKIPTSPLAPAVNSPMEPMKVEIPFGPLGPPAHPVNLLGDEDQTPGFQTADLQRESTERLRLGPPAAGPEAVVQLDLFRSISYAVHNNRDYKSQMEDMYISTLGVLLQRHVFEPHPFATSELKYARGDGSPTTRPNGSERWKYDSALTATETVGLTQNLPMGGSITAQALMAFTDALNDNTDDGESGTIALSGTIPLLRGAGMVNLEPLILSERQLVYQIRDFESFRRDFVVEIANDYFQLISKQQSIVNRRLKYISSSNLTTQTRELYGAGRINFLQVQQSLQTALQDENALVDAEQDYQDSLDKFKIELGMPIDQNLDVQGVELDLNIPDVDHADISALVLKYRLDLQTDRDKIEDSRRNIDVKKNQLLPDLDVTATAGLHNIDGQAAVKLDRHVYDYSVDALLKLPLDRVQERNDYRIALIDFEQALRKFEGDRDTDIATARSSARSLRNAQITLDIQRRAIDLAQQKLDYSSELLTQGKAITRDVVEAQSDLLNAQDSYDAAKTNLQVQILSLLRDTGTLRMDPDAGSLGHAMDLAETSGVPADNVSRKAQS